jgi:hypothetical protein
MSQPARRHHFRTRTRGRDGPLRLRAGGGGIVPSAQRLAHLDMRSSEPTMLTARASHCCKTRTRLTSKLAQALEQRPRRGLSWLVVVVL